MKLVFISPVYNASAYLDKFVNSLVSQTYTNFVVYLVDDISTDDTVSKYISITKTDSRFKLIERKEKFFAGRNRVRTFQDNKMNIDPEDIIILLDGDDWLFNQTTLEYLVSVYEKENIWMTYGSHLWYLDEGVHKSDEENRFCRPIGSDIEILRDENTKFFLFHLRTIKAFVYNEIKDSVVQDELGNWLKTGCDVSLLISCAELCGVDKIKFIERYMVFYNFHNPLSDYKTAKLAQWNTNQIVKKKKRSDPLDSNLHGGSWKY